MKQLKILFTGSFCSGKSTLVNLLINQLSSVHVIHEVTREVLSLYGKVDWSMPELRDYILVKQILEEKKAISSDVQYILVDSGIISFLAHDRVLLPGRKRKNVLDYFKYQMYDIIFVCDHKDVLLYDDGERYTNSNLRDSIANEVFSVLDELQLDYIMLLGNNSERISTVFKHLNSIKE